MTLSNKQRPFFFTGASSTESAGMENNMGDIVSHLQTALAEPLKTAEMEATIERILLKNGYDPAQDLGWEKAGVEGLREGAVQTIKKAYLSAVPVALDAISRETQFNRDAYTPSAIDANNPLATLVSSFKRAHQEYGDLRLLTDAAWQEAGVSSAAAFQETLRGIFVEASVGVHVAQNANRIDELSKKTADYAIQRAFPELAEELEIPLNIKAHLTDSPKKYTRHFGFGKASDCHPQ